MKLQVVITSYNRKPYFRETLMSLGLNSSGDNEIEVFVVDGGSDDGTVEYIQALYDEDVISGYAIFEGNPGADVLKSYGLDRFVTEDKCLLTSDDLGFPKNYDRDLLAAWEDLKDSKTVAVLCSIDNFAANHIPFPYTIKGHAVNPHLIFQPCGLVDKNILKSFDYWPRQYGVTGCGDFAINRRMRENGYVAYFLRDVTVTHIGQKKDVDYPEAHAFYIEHEKEVYPKAIIDIEADIPLNQFVPTIEESK